MPCIIKLPSRRLCRHPPVSGRALSGSDFNAHPFRFALFVGMSIARPKQKSKTERLIADDILALLVPCALCLVPY